MRPLLLALAVALACPAGASASTTINGVADRGTAALYRGWQAASQIPTPTVVVNIAERGCAEAGAASCIRGCHASGPMTLVYADPSWLWREAGSPARLADRLGAQATFSHELAHLRDCQPRKSHGYRKAFARIMGWRIRADLSSRARDRIDDDVANIGLYEDWRVCVNLTASYCADPAELFAMASEWCAIDLRRRTPAAWAAGYGYAPTLAQHRAACVLLRAGLN